MALPSLPISTQHPPLSLPLLQPDYPISVFPCYDGRWPGAKQNLASNLCHPLVPLAVLCHTRCFGKAKPFKMGPFPCLPPSSRPYPRVPGTEDEDLASKGRDPVCRSGPCLSPLLPAAARVSRASVSGCVAVPSQSWKAVSPTWSPHSLWLDGVSAGGNWSERLELQTSFTGTWSYDKKDIIYWASHTRRGKDKRMRKSLPGSQASFLSPHPSHRPEVTSFPL